MSIKIIRQSDAAYRAAVDELRDMLRGGELAAAGESSDLDIPQIVKDVLADVKARGDTAVAELTEKIEKVTLSPKRFRVSAGEIEAAHKSTEPEFLALVRRVAGNIREYQEHIRIQAPPALKRGGRVLGVKYSPVDRVAVYVPGGRAVYPSSLLMTIVPALVAGVPELAMITPPTGGDVNPMVLALAGELGVREVYRVSGTAGIAAAAYGTESIPAVNKIVGPGNAFIAEAKRQVSGLVGIDSIAGASEVFIIADETANPQWVAADLLAQAEHNPGSAVLATTSEKLAAAVSAALEEQLPELERAEATRVMLEKYCAIIVADDMDTVCDLANDFATEHLQIITAEAENVAAKIRNAGATFIGGQTPVPVGDYYAGPSHVLPTRGTAKFFSPLSVNDFLKSSSIIKFDAESLSADAQDIIDFATREGLTAHANAVRVRMSE